MKKDANSGGSIDDLSRDIGIGKDTLRVWERRYGFPRPVRNALGQRSYPEEQQEQLRIICRLLDQGYRPGKIVPLDREQLELLGNEIEENGSGNDCSMINQLMMVINSGQASQLNKVLQEILDRQGAYQFVLDTAAPLLEQIGKTWANGQLPIYIEHLITYQLKAVLNGAGNAINLNPNAPQVILTTLPGEPHGIGLSMVELLLRIEGFSPLSLGVETPVDQIIEACINIKPQALALSFSSLQKRTTVITGLTELSNRIPEPVLLLAGGKGIQKLRSVPARVRVVKKLDQLGSSLRIKANAV